MIKSGKIFYELCLIPTERCNLSCRYCFVDKAKAKSMTFSTACEQIDMMMNAPEDFAGYEVSFMGGEPFLKFDLIRDIIDYACNKYGENRIHFSAVTNGTLVHDDIQDWIRDNQHKIHVTLSIDGSRETHNAQRSNSFDKIDLDFFASLKKPVANMVITPESLEHLSDNVRFLEGKGFYVKTFLEEGVRWEKTHLPILTEQLMMLINHYLYNPDLLPTTLLANSLYLLLDENLPSACSMEAYSYAVSADGIRYDCHRCMPFESNPLMPIPKEYLNNFRHVRHISPVCDSCFINYLCNSCPASNATRIRNKELAENYCLQRKLLYRAQAYFLLKAFENDSNGRIFRRMSADRLKKTISASKRILQEIDSTKAF